MACFAVGGSNPTTKAFTDRITSLGSLESDVSAQERLGAANLLLPTAVAQPVGAGLGQAGLAAELSSGESAESTLVNIDNGYLSLMYQLGPFGFVLVVAAIAISLTAALRGLDMADGAERQARGAQLATLVMLLVALAAANVFFGLPGVFLWYLCGMSVASSAEEARSSSAEVPSRATKS